MLHTSFRGFHRSYQIVADYRPHAYKLAEYMDLARPLIVASLKDCVRELGAIKVDVAATCMFRFDKKTADGVVRSRTIPPPTFHSRARRVLAEGDVETRTAIAGREGASTSTGIVGDIADELNERVHDYLDNSRNYDSQEIRCEAMYVNVAKYDPLHAVEVGGSYMVLPPSIQKRRACINVQNTDEKCFAWSILAALQY